MTSQHSDFNPPTEMALTDIFLDPNNPRISPEPAPGYEDTALLLDPARQPDLVKRVYEVYNAGALESMIIEQGWTPVDPIIVWCPPGSKKAVVVEGNTRISVLGNVRLRLPKELAKLERMTKGGFAPNELRRQRDLVDAIQALVAQTNNVRVYPVHADTAAELKEKLPRLLGVRHISPAKNWTPYATNLYILTLYRAAFGKKHGPDETLALEDDVLNTVAHQLPMKPEEIRRAIQAASAFSHFKMMYGERVEEAGNRFKDGDQYFFDLILAHKHAREEFGFESRDLNLKDDAEEALFQWAFSQPRNGAGGDEEDDKSANVFQKAEDIRAWQKIARYDAQTGFTNFARRLQISAPSEAIPIWRLAIAQGAHKEQNTPVKTLSDLAKALKELKADTLQAQATMLLPILRDISNQVNSFREMAETAAQEQEPIV
ncbi:hypothetical protein [Brevundimonas variabilis]|uniref:ParB/Sulfiredoxin domain-containing protein n=1 Tax=Brevundimonas variabilis TaxID=74312 RepID=A0A7W9CJX5_9CAUL|nr:hypothetical protein [Brevundimonas variabilis]MBB5747053.1 hypothetical protein [Brevundimonas variabilis]